MSILRVKGVAVADATQMVAAGRLRSRCSSSSRSTCRRVLDYSPIQTGIAYLPLTGGFIIAAEHLLAALRAHRHQAGHPRRRRDRGRRPLLAVADPGRRLLRLGHPARPPGRLDRPRRRLHRAATTAANAGVDEDKAGLAAGLLNTGQQLGTALGLAILSALATARTTSLLDGGHDSVAQAATDGYQRALMAGACLVLAASVVALLRPNTRQSDARRRGRASGRAGTRPRGLDRWGSRTRLPHQLAPADQLISSEGGTGDAHES